MYLKKIMKRIVRLINDFDRRKPKVATISETVDYICRHKVSVSRFGDGEFKWIYGLKQNSFEVQSNELSKRLKEVIQSDLPNHIVCIPEGTFRLDMYTEEAKEWWINFSSKYRILWNNMLDLRKQYYNADISRPYINLKDKDRAREHFDNIKRIWNKRNLLIVEGEKTRLGINNDLFTNSLCIRRIICPSQNAFSKYSEILDAAKKYATCDDLVLIALGPTATILAYDLAKEGIQAIDIGHIDIEYEWFKMGALTKIPIVGKYVNEASKLGGDKPDDSIVNKTYLGQIICRIE